MDAEQKKEILTRIDHDLADDIIAGRKTIDVHFRKPRLKLPFKVYLYDPVVDGCIGEYMCDRFFVFDPPSTTLDKIGISVHDAKNCIIYGWQMSKLKIYQHKVPISQFYEPCDKNCSECDYSCYDPHDEMPGRGESYCGIGDVESNLQPPEDWCYVEPLW